MTAKEQAELERVLSPTERELLTALRKFSGRKAHDGDIERALGWGYHKMNVALRGLANVKLVRRIGTFESHDPPQELAVWKAVKPPDLQEDLF